MSLHLTKNLNFSFVGKQETHLLTNPLNDSLQLVSDFLTNNSTNKLCLVFPSKEYSAQWISIVSAIEIIEKDYKKYKSEILKAYEKYKLGQKLLQRPNTSLVLALGQLQQLCQAAKLPIAFTSSSGIVQYAEHLQELSLASEALLITKHNGMLHVAHKGEVISTPHDDNDSLWSVECAAYMAVWTLQNPQKPLQAAACAAYELATKNTK